MRADFCAVDLPLVGDFTRLIQMLADGLPTDNPYLVYGHSQGALIACLP